MNDIENYFQILLNDTTNPCMLVDSETLEVVFSNSAMKKMLKESKSLDNIIDTDVKCYELLHNTHKPCKHCNIDLLESDIFREFTVYNENLDRTYRVSNTTIIYKGRKYNLNKFFITNSFVNHESSFNDAINKSLKIFTKSNLDEMTNDFLILLGEFYKSEKSYVYYLNKEKDNLINQHNWVLNDKNSVPNDIVSKIKLDTFLTWLDNCNEQDIIEVNNFSKEIVNTELEQTILNSFGVDSITLCLIKDDNNEIIGFVGVSNRSVESFDYRLLKSTTNFIKEKFNKNYMQEELKLISDIDFLTGFFSRNKYTEQLKFLENNKPRNIGVVFVNINGLRKTNDTLGQSEGDKLISKSSDIFKKFYNEPIYRISGDEFICFCIGDEELDFIKRVNSLREYLKEIDDYPFAVGHAWKSNNYNIQKLVVESDVLMYINKQDYYYTINRSLDDYNDNTLKELLSHIDNDEFLVYLQPQFELATNKIAASEALIRRFDKVNRHMVFPDQFIPMYEQKSVIRHVDIFVVNKVCETLANWIKIGKEIPIAVNLSRVTLLEFDIVNTIAKICDKYNVPHELLIIEVTERVGLIENEVTSTLIDEFKGLGFKLSLDDFGCAYSNIVTLANISIDEVKIDKSLVDNLIDNKKNRVIVESVIKMCENIGDTHTLAEGIETEEQAEILRQLNCKYGQGYLYSKPIPIEEFEEKYINN